MFAPPNEKRKAFDARVRERKAAERSQIDRCYSQYLTPQERAARDAARLAKGLGVVRRRR